MTTIDDALVMILAGGEGKRLYPLTRDRAKPAVPFGGRYHFFQSLCLPPAQSWC